MLLDLIVELLSEGWGTKHIAEELDVSYATVRGHMRNLYAEAGIDVRAVGLNDAKAELRAYLRDGEREEVDL